MKAQLLSITLVLLLAAPFFLGYNKSNAQATGQSTPDVYVGIYLAYGGTTAAKALIDEVNGYTNFLAVGTTMASSSGDTLNETLQYAYDKGMYFISFSPWNTGLPGNSSEINEWFNYAKEKWGDHLIGFLTSGIDEPGGRQLDLSESRAIRITSANNYSDAATQFENLLSQRLNYVRSSSTSGLSYASYPLFTCDYALYSFDYKAGYDSVLAEFGWNYSRQLNVALCRGAATTQNKDWGVIIDWTYTVPPYIESGPELYNDLVTAYNNGAKYITVFDTNKEYTQDILGTEQLQALQQFWQYIQNNPRKTSPVSDRVAFVLPQDYGYGFRGPNDKSWGLWEADNMSTSISSSVGALLKLYGDKLDIIYDNNLQPGNNYGYSKLIYWNDSSISELINPSPSPDPSVSPSPSSSPQSTDSNPGNIINLSANVIIAFIGCAITIPVILVAIVSKKRRHSSLNK